MTARWWLPVLWRVAMIWVPIAVAVTGLAALVYAAVQHELRQSANDPQVQLAEDTAARLDAGATPSAVLPAERVEMSSSLAPYVMVFDANGEQIASSAVLQGTAPPFPASVFEAVRSGGQDAITWQPQLGVRSAAVVQHWRGGFVVAGRSLRLVEERENHVLLLSAFMWVLTLGATAIASTAVALVAASRSGEIDLRAMSIARRGPALRG
ncbi:MAG: hypothetical protein JOZ87_04015 [Chloroflexi bacterium]|nr:hypothetical protein [Chloroflexota bacterium]